MFYSYVFPYRNNDKLNRNKNINNFFNLHFKYVIKNPFALFLITKPIKLVSVTPKTDTISVSNVKPISEFMTPTTFFYRFQFWFRQLSDSTTLQIVRFWEFLDISWSKLLFAQSSILITLLMFDLHGGKWKNQMEFKSLLYEKKISRCSRVWRGAKMPLFAKFGWYSLRRYTCI